MFYLTRLALKNIARHPVRSFLTVAGIAFSVAVILAVFITNTAIQRSAAETLAELGTGKTGIWVEEVTEDTASIGSKQEGFSTTIAAKISRKEYVSSVHPMVKVYTTAPAENGVLHDFYLYGVDFATDRVVRNYRLSQGFYPNQPQEVMIGERLAQKLNIGVHSRLTLPSPQGQLQLRVSGILASDEGTGTLNNNRIIIADLAMVQQYFGYEGKITSLNIVLKPGVKAVNIVNQVRRLLPDNITAFTDPIMEAAGGNSTESLQTTAFVFGLITIFIAAFIIFNTLASSVEQSRKELGLLRLIGMTRNQVARYFLQESLVYGVIGACIGLGLGVLTGFGLLYIVNHFIFQFKSLFLEWPAPAALLSAVGIGIVTTVIVGIFPALKAAKTSPLNVFRMTGSGEAEPRFSIKTLIGVCSVGVGLLTTFLPLSPKGYLYLRFFGPLFLFIGLCLVLDLILPAVLNVLHRVFNKIFGLPGLLAVQSLRLRLKRTVITVGSVAVALGIMIGFLGMMHSTRTTVTNWYDHTKWADVLIFSASGAEINPSILKEIESYSFVKNCNPMRYRFVPYIHEGLSDNGFIFQGVDPVKFQEFTGIKGVTESKNFRRLPEILVNKNLANKLTLNVGDILNLKTNQGVVPFRVKGLVTDYSDFIHRLGKVVYGSYRDLKNFYGVTGYTIIQIRLAGGYPQANAKQQLLAKLSGRYNIKVITHYEEKADVGASVDRIFSMYYALLAVIFLIVFMGIFNTILINVLFQMGEFAILRTAGCLVKQIRTIINCEALIMAVAGSFMAILTGFWLSAQLTASEIGILGATIKHFLPFAATLALISTTIIISLIATVYPQKVATGISISKVMQNVNE